MAGQHEIRSGKDRRSFDMSSVMPINNERRWNKDRRFMLEAEEDDSYDADWESFLEADLELFARRVLKN